VLNGFEYGLLPRDVPVFWYIGVVGVEIGDWFLLFKSSLKVVLIIKLFILNTLDWLAPYDPLLPVPAKVLLRVIELLLNEKLESLLRPDKILALELVKSLLTVFVLSGFGDPENDSELNDEPNGEFIGELRLLPLIFERIGLVCLVSISKDFSDKLLPVLATVLLIFREDDEDIILLMDKCLVSLLLIPKLAKDVFFVLSAYVIDLVIVNIGVVKEVVVKALKLPWEVAREVVREEDGVQLFDNVLFGSEELLIEDELLNIVLLLVVLVNPLFPNVLLLELRL